MKELPLQDWAKRLLEDQIERLGELRNANPRDQSFKLWRQTTLTVIQRLWPGNLPKSEQFRRIAFTTPSARATRNQVRQHYERGCGEAVAYLRMLMMEVDAGALSLPTDGVALEATGEALSPPVVPDAPEDAVRDTRGLDEGLVGSGPLSPTSPEVVQTGPPLQFISPAFDRDPEFRSSGHGNARAASGHAAPTPEPAAPEPPAPVKAQAPIPPKAKPSPLVVKAQEPIPPPPRPTAAAPPPPKPVAAPPPPAAPAAASPVAMPAEMSADDSRARRTDKRPLKEMLGFVDAPATPARGPASSPPAAPSSGSGWFEPPQDEPDDALEEPETDPFEHDDEEEEPVETDHDPGPFRASDLLDPPPRFVGSARTPAPAPVPAPRAPAPTPAPRVPASSSGNALSAVLNALAADVTRLGVPEGQRAATRAALVGLGRQFDLGTANWSSVRQTIVMVLEYPALARLLIPALVPYLNLE